MSDLDATHQFQMPKKKIEEHIPGGWNRVELVRNLNSPCVDCGKLDRVIYYKCLPIGPKDTFEKTIVKCQECISETK